MVVGQTESERETNPGPLKQQLQTLAAFSLASAAAGGGPCN